MEKNHEFDVVFLVLFFVGIAFVLTMHFSSYTMGPLEKRVSLAYSLFTNRQLNKQLEYTDDGKTWVLVTDKRTEYNGTTNIEFNIVEFSDKEREKLIGDSNNFIHYTVGYALNGYFTNEWKMSEKIILKGNK